MDRILRKTAAEIRVTIYVDGVATDADSAPTVTVTRDSDGAVIVNGANSTAVANTTGVYSYQLAAGDIPEVDILRADWTATIGGNDSTFRTDVEVVGGFIVGLEEIKASAPSTPSDDDAIDARAWAEDWLEDACGVAFRPRYAKESFDGDTGAVVSGSLVSPGGSMLFLSRPRPTRILAASNSGTALTVDELGALVLYNTGRLYRPAGWSLGFQNVAIAYEHGFEAPPAPVVEAALKLARHKLTPRPSNLDERASSYTTDDATYSLVTPGRSGAVTSIPEVNAVIDQYRYPSIG